MSEYSPHHMTEEEKMGEDAEKNHNFQVTVENSSTKE